MRRLVFSLLFFSILVQSQNEYPRLNVSGMTKESFVPLDWKMIAFADGDLNDDQLLDFAFVIEKKLNDPVGIDSIAGTNVLRILGVFLKQKEGGYIKHTQSNTFIISRDNSEMGEPFQGLFITGEGYLDLNFQIWTKEKLWFITTHSFRFQLQNNKFGLVMYSLNESNRDSGDSTDYNLNFLSRKMSVDSYNFLQDKKPTSEVVKLKAAPLRTLETMLTPFEISIWD